MHNRMRERNHYGRLLLYFSVIVVWSWLIPQPAVAANEAVGKTSALTGSVSIQREGKTWQLQVGEYIHLHDRLQTGIVSRVEILFMDQSRIRMAPNTTLEITEYLYQPEKKKRKGLLSLWAGKARFIVNDLVDYTQKDFEVRTQAGIAGTRGTDFVMEIKKRKSEKIGALGKHWFDLQQEIERFVKQHKFPSWLANAQFVANGPVNFSHEGLLVYAAGEDISSERQNPSSTMKLAQEDEETEGVVTVIEGEVFVCPKDEEGNIILEECVTVTRGEYVLFGIDNITEPIADPGQVEDAQEGTEPVEAEPEPAPEITPPVPSEPPPNDLPGEEPFEPEEDIQSPFSV
jgi:hypothetical protein